MLKLVKIKKTVCPQCTLLDIMLQASGIEPNETLNVDDDESLIEKYDLQGVPVLLFEKDGEIVDRIDSTRGLTPDVIIEKMEQHGA